MNYKYRNNCSIAVKTVEVVVVDNAAGSDLLYCNNDPH